MNLSCVFESVKLGRGRGGASPPRGGGARARDLLPLPLHHVAFRELVPRFNFIIASPWHFSVDGPFDAGAEPLVH